MALRVVRRWDRVGDDYEYVIEDVRETESGPRISQWEDGMFVGTSVSHLADLLKQALAACTKPIYAIEPEKLVEVKEKRRRR